jgi:hypothetical protein
MDGVIPTTDGFRALEQPPCSEGFDRLPADIVLEEYEGEAEKNLMTFCLLTAFLLYLIDWIVMLFIHLGIKFSPLSIKKISIFAAGFILSLAFLSPVTQAAEKASDSLYAAQIYMAYVHSGNAAVDEISKDGLQALANALKERTSIEPAGVVALDLEKDDLAFFPFIYWPITEGQAAPSSKALQNVQFYLDHGGTVLFDTRDKRSEVTSGYNAGMGHNADDLRRIVGALNIPPLEPIPKDHVLTKSFYLLQSFPGRYEFGTVWVEGESESGRDGVSSVIIGSHDWAYAWASALRASNGYRISGATRNEDLALRFGLNVMMYALTGNYKDDQVHVPHILERLGR